MNNLSVPSIKNSESSRTLIAAARITRGINDTIASERQGKSAIRKKPEIATTKENNNKANKIVFCVL